MSHNKHEHTQFLSQPGHQDSTSALAYHLWEQAGRPDGQAQRFWAEAEEQIKQSYRQAAAPLH